MSEQFGLGAVPSPYDARDYQIIAPQVGDYPEEFALTDMPSALNQTSVGSCVAHALAVTMAWHLFRQTKQKTRMSIIGIYGNRRNSLYKNSGMIVRDAITEVKDFGNPLYDLLPGNSEVPEAINIFEANYAAIKSDALQHVITGYARVNSENAIKHALMNYGPVIFVVPWFKDMKLSKSNVLDSVSYADAQGAHCMIIYGWTVVNERAYWLIQNSWGEGWGDHGRALLPMNFPLSESWEVLDDYVEGTDDIIKPYNTKIGRWFARIINYVKNFIRRIKNDCYLG